MDQKEEGMKKEKERRKQKKKLMVGGWKYGK